MLLCAISISVFTSFFVLADADSNSLVVILVYNVLLYVSLVSFFVVGGIFFKKSTSVFIEMDNVLTVNSLFKYMCGKVTKETISVYMEKKLEFSRFFIQKYHKAMREMEIEEINRQNLPTEV